MAKQVIRLLLIGMFLLSLPASVLSSSAPIALQQEEYILIDIWENDVVIEFNHPWAVAVHGDLVYVADAADDRIQIFNPSRV